MSQWQTMFIYVLLLSWSSDVVAQSPQPVTNDTNQAVDLMLMVDASFYISRDNFTALLASVARFVGTLPLGPSAVHVAALSYSNIVDRSDFNSDSTLAQRDVLDLFYDGQSALTHIAFDEVYSVMTSRRSLRPEARKIVILITGSFARYPQYSRDSAEKLLASDVEIWAVGIGPYIRYLELLDYTRNSSRIILWDRFDVLPPVPLGFSSTLSPTPVASTSNAATATPRIELSTNSSFTFASLETTTPTGTTTEFPTAASTQVRTWTSATATASAIPTATAVTSTGLTYNVSTSVVPTDTDRVSISTSNSTTPAFTTGAESTSKELTTSTHTSPTVRQDFECHLSYMQVFIPAVLVPNSELTLRDPTCKLNNNGTHHKITFAYDECGTLETFYTDYVDIQNEISVHLILNDTDMITFVEDYKIPLQCSLDRSQMLNIAIQVEPRERIAEQVEHSADFSLKEYSSADYNEEITEYPVKVPLNREIFFEITLRNNSNSSLGVYVERCVATPSPDPNDTTHVALIDVGCSAHPAVKVQPATEVGRFRFSTQAFRFSGQTAIDNLVYIHCSVSTCGGSNCQHPCLPNSRRRRSARKMASVILTSGSHVVTS